MILLAISVTVASTVAKPCRPVGAQPVVSLGMILPPMSLTIVGTSGTEVTLNEVDIGNMVPYESYGGYKNQLGNIKGMGNYTGVPLLALCNLVGGITANDSLLLTATDNYTATLTYSQVANGDFVAYDNVTGQETVHNQTLTPILAYYFDKMNITDGPLKLAIVGPEGLATSSSYWVKSVAEIQVLLGYVVDVAVTNMIPSRTVVGRSFTSGTNVTVANLGGVGEIFNCSLYANSTIIGNAFNLSLASTASTTLNFAWNTSEVAYGNYTVWAYIPLVLGENNTHNNNCTGGWVIVTIPGDLNGDFQVKLGDLVILANAYGCRPGGAKWNPNADIDNNGVIGLSDLVILAVNYGRHNP
jgi:hypothetical protein